MTSKVFVDSSLLVEYAKGSKIKLLNHLLQDDSIELSINETVVSEFMFQLLKMNGGKSPRSIQSSNQISLVLSKKSDYNLLHFFHFMQNDKALYHLVPDLMAKYNLIPNNAIILATCKIHNITKLGSHDTDFEIPCKAESIEWLHEA